MCIKSLNPIKFKAINGILILIIFVSWIKIATLNWIVPEWVRTIWITPYLPYNPNITTQLNCMSTSYILSNFVPYFALFLTSVIIFFIINTRKVKINSLKIFLMKFTFYSILISSILFILVYNMPGPLVLVPMILRVYVINLRAIQFYYTCLSVIAFILIDISIIGLLLLGKLNIEGKMENHFKSLISNSLTPSYPGAFVLHTQSSSPHSELGFLKL
jgi:hypothetical protein